MHSKNLKFILLLLLISVLAISGCVTAPVKVSIPTYSLRGDKYVSLLALCSSRAILWEYDSVSRVVELKKDGHTVTVRVGDSLALVDGKTVQLSNPVDIYQGMVVIPYKAKEKIIDSICVESGGRTRSVFLSSALKKVVVDAGHGGRDPGTTGRSGLKEKDVNLDIAKRLAKLFRESGVQVILTRSNDTFIPLARRTSIANDSKADLFISIHGNANRVRSLNGFEVYYVTAAHNNDAKRALSAAKDATPDIEGSSFAFAGPDTKAIVWDMIHTSDRAESVKLGRALCRTVKGQLYCKILGVKAANFYVLKGTRMPAVLIETGFLSNKDEERQLKNSFYRQQIAEAIMHGVQEYVSESHSAEAS